MTPQVSENQTNAKKQLDDMTRAFFQAFSPDESGEVCLDVIRHLFIPQGILVKNVGPDPEIYSVDGFIEPREKLLNDGSLTDFQEEELHEKTEIFGQVAHRFLLYRKHGKFHDEPFDTLGMKTIQFIHTPQGWKMTSLAWDDERDGLSIPDHLKNLDNQVDHGKN